MCAGDVHQAPFEQFQGDGTVHRGRHQPHTGPLQVAAQHRDRRVAAGDEQPGRRVFRAQPMHRGACGIDQERVRRRELPGARNRRHGDQPALHPAQFHGRAREGLARRNQVGARGARRRQGRCVQCEQLFDAGFERPREFQRHGRVRDIVARLHRVDRLPGDCGGARRLRRRHAALTASFGQAVGHALLRRGIVF